MDNGDSHITVQLDTDVIKFTPNDLNDFPIHASDFMQITEGMPMLVYTNGADKYIVALRWRGDVDVFNLILSSPSSQSINASYQVVYFDMVSEEVKK